MLQWTQYKVYVLEKPKLTLEPMVIMLILQVHEPTLGLGLMSDNISNTPSNMDWESEIPLVYCMGCNTPYSLTK